MQAGTWTLCFLLQCYILEKVGLGLSQLNFRRNSGLVLGISDVLVISHCSVLSALIKQSNIPNYQEIKWKKGRRGRRLRELSIGNKC